MNDNPNDMHPPGLHRGRPPVRRLAVLVTAVLTIAAGTASSQPAKVADTLEQRVAACVACHGKEGRATSEGFFPRIAGKPAGYLYNQLINFREGRRQYPAMTYLVAHLSDDYLREMAEHFSNLHPPYPPPQAPNVSPATLERGRTLVVSGDAARGIPACIACHGRQLTGVSPAIPGLIGLPRDYLNAQFGAWKTGSRKAAAPDCMAQISRQLNPEDVAAISAWLASRPLPADMSPASSLPGRPPIACGSIPH